MSSWECTSELAVKSNPADFETGDALFRSVDQAVEEIGAGFTGAGGAGWDGIEGDYASGLQHVATVVGEQVGELAVRASVLARYHARAASTLGPLQIESDNLLVEAEETLLLHNIAKKAHSKLMTAVHYWRGERDSHPHSSDEWNGANSTYSIVSRAAAEQYQVVVTTAEELDAHQVTFTTLREDEKTAHQGFADEVNGVNLETTLVDVQVSGSATVSVGMLLDLFEAGTLTIPSGARAVTSRTQLSRFWAGRSAIAALADVDLADRDRRIDDVHLKRDFDELLPLEVRDEINQALRDGSAEDASRLARMLDLGLFEMSDDERFDYLYEFRDDVITPAIGWLPLITLFAAAPDRAIPRWMIDELARNQGFYEWTAIPNLQTREMLAGIVGVDSADPNLNATALASLFSRILETPYGLEQLQNPDTTLFRSDWAVPAVAQYLHSNPHIISHLAKSEDFDKITELQRYLDLVDRGTTDGEFDAFLTVVAISIANPASTNADTDYTEHLGPHMQARAASIGRLLYEASRVNESASFDPSALIFVLSTALIGPAVVPLAGKAAGVQATVALKSIKAMWGGVEGSTRTADTAFEASRYEEQTMLAVVAIASVGGPAAERLGELADAYPDPQDFLDHLDGARTNAAASVLDPNAVAHPDQDIAIYVDLFVDEINSRVVDVTSND